MTAVAVVAGGAVLALFFSYHAYALLENNKSDGWNQALSIFLILMGFVTMWSVGHTVNLLAATMSPEIAASTSITYWVSVVGGTVVLMYFVLRLLFNSLQLAFLGRSKR